MSHISHGIDATLLRWWDSRPAGDEPRGTRVWRAYFKDRASFCFGLYVGYGAEEAAAHAMQWGTVSSVEPVT